MLAVFAASAWSSAESRTPTFDEPYDISMGYDFWIHGHQRWDFLHTSFSRKWVSLPLLFLNPSFPEGITNQGDLAYRFVYENRISPETIFMWGRVMSLIPALGLVVLVFLFSKERFGPWAGLLSVFLTIIDPNILAHAAIPKNDILAALAFAACVYAFWKLFDFPDVKHAVLAGIVCGVTFLVKYSLIFIPPVLWGIWFFLSKPEDRRKNLKLSGLMVVISMFVIFADSGFELISVSEFVKEQSLIQGEAVPLEFPGWATIKIPFLRYLFGIWVVFTKNSLPRPVFFLGELIDQGSILFFPVIFIIKTSIFILILLAWISAQNFKGFANVQGKDWLLWGGPAVYLFLLLGSNLNPGYRHLFPIICIIYIGAGAAVSRLEAKLQKGILTSLLLGGLLSNVFAYPHYLSFFNEFVGDRGYQFVGDSNIDWGQDLVRLAEYQSENNLGRVYLSYFGTADPNYYGVTYDCLPSFGLLDCPDADLPQQGWVAVSLNCLNGFCTYPNDIFGRLRSRRPDEVIGSSIFLYHLP